MYAVVKEIARHEKDVLCRERLNPKKVIRCNARVWKSAEPAEHFGTEQRARRTALEEAGAEEFALVGQLRRQQHRTSTAGPITAARQGEAGAGFRIERLDH